MNGISRRFTLIAAVASCLASGGTVAAFGQEVHLKSRDVHTGLPVLKPLDIVRPQAKGIGPKQPRPRRTSPIHQIIQFDHLPGVEDIDALLEAGFSVVGAVPDNALMVIAPEPLPPPAIGVRWVGELDESDKLSPELANSGLELGANAVLAIVEFHADVEPETQQSIAAESGLAFLRPAILLRNHVIVSASLHQLRALAANDEVAYIFPADPALLTAGNGVMQCAGMLTLAGPVAQYANIVNGWGLGADRAAHLGYAFGALTSKVPAATVESEILRAMNAWSAVTNVVFEAAPSATAARTVFLEFVSGAHGDSYPFDHSGSMVAHTFYPVPLNSESIAGDIHLDADVNWNAGGDVDIYSVVLHELGHALGLTHSDKPGDVMYPYYQRGMQLSANDIGAVQQLYGLADTAPQSAAPITALPVISAIPLKLNLNPIPPPGTAAQATIAGIVSGGVPPLALQYQTSAGYSGIIGTGVAGTFSATGVALVTGSNTVTVTAFDSASQTASESEVVTRTSAAASIGTIPLTVRITSPSSAVSTSKGAHISASGTASGGTGITQVTWQTSTGASGTADGAGTWVACDIALLSGTNTIVIRAYDASGASAWATVVVVRP